jgi:hypothetical protein
MALCISLKICKRPDVLWSDHGSRLHRSITIDLTANHMRIARKKRIHTTSLPELAKVTVVLS